MKVTLDITDEYIDILAKVFGYQDKVTEPNVIKDEVGNKKVEHREVDNPMSKADFIANVEISRLTNMVKSQKEQEAVEAHRLKVAKEMESSKGIKKA